MKRILSILLAVFLSLVLAACGTVGGAALPDVPVSEQALAPAAQSAQELPSTSDAHTDAQAPPEDTVEADISTDNAESAAPVLREDGSYTSREDVALYIHLYGHLPDNFITKSEAKALGWPGGSLEPYAPGRCIGGDRFGNYEGLLPDAKGRKWTECDVDTMGAESRGAKRIIFSNDGLIYYTQDHYKSFELLYGEE